jgi:hypothetical protein
LRGGWEDDVPVWSARIDGRGGRFGIWLVGIVLPGGVFFFSANAAFFGDVEDVLDLGLDDLLKCDERTCGAAFRLFVQVIEMPLLFQAEREAVEGIKSGGAG